MYLIFFKPLFDKLVAICVLLITSPILIIAVLGLSFANRGKIWFLQPRPGQNEKIFRVIKFKTMTDQLDRAGQLLPDEKRLTSIGKFIRSTSIDELPQLINVILGDMSLVGPRPLLVEYLQLYSPEQRRRHALKPGITGWAQVNGRNLVDWKKKFELDVWYVNHVSFVLDLKILLMTVFKVVKSEGVASSSSATMERFRGNPEDRS